MAEQKSDPPVLFGVSQPRQGRLRQIRRSKETSPVRAAAAALSPDLLPKDAKQIRLATPRQLRRTRQVARLFPIDIDIDIIIIINKISLVRTAQARQIANRRVVGLIFPRSMPVEDLSKRANIAKVAQARIAQGRQIAAIKRSGLAQKA